MTLRFPVQATSHRQLRGFHRMAAIHRLSDGRSHTRERVDYSHRITSLQKEKARVLASQACLKYADAGLATSS